DATRGKHADTGEPLPRVAPLRVRLGLEAERGPWGARVEADHAERQRRVPSTDTPTAGYTLVNLAFTRRFGVREGEGVWFVKIDNAGDRLAFSASTPHTVRGLTPLPGRALKAGVRVAF
ncbi:MAG TPA: TonB-dependent receptor, partial [Albitalea sp.]